MEDFIFLRSKITVHGGYSHVIKRHLLLGGKTMTNLDSMLKTRDITLPTECCLVKAMVFPVVPTTNLKRERLMERYENCCTLEILSLFSLVLLQTFIEYLLCAICITHNS